MGEISFNFNSVHMELTLFRDGDLLVVMEKGEQNGFYPENCSGYLTLEEAIRLRDSLTNHINKFINK